MPNNLISDNLFAQAKQEGRRHKLIDMIIYVRENDKYVKDEDAFDISSNGMKRQKANTQGWEVCIKWKYESTTCNTLKDINDPFPVELADYVVENRMAFKPAFAWWVPYILKK